MTIPMGDSSAPKIDEADLPQRRLANDVHGPLELLAVAAKDAKNGRGAAIPRCSESI